MSEIWFRNPSTYVKELAEVGGPFRVVWDRGILVKKHIDPYKHASLYFGENSDWRVLLIGPQGTCEIGPGRNTDNPIAVYPAWEYGEDIDLLEDMLTNAPGSDPNACTDMSVPSDERPVMGQEHRVVIIGLPNASVRANRPFYRQLTEMQEDYSEAIIHVHGSYSYRVMFGSGYGSADSEPRSEAAMGNVMLPSGKKMNYAKTVTCAQWIHLLGFKVPDLKIPRNRCMYNIKSAKWAAEHFTEDIKFRTKGTDSSDPNSKKTLVPTTAATRTRLSISPTEGDRITCDTCSLADHCKYFRVGAVCSVPSSETSPLAKYFQSRDSSKIIDGLGTILAAQTNRLERGMVEEEEYGELDPEVTKLMNQLFSNGVKLAKLVDPTLTKPGVVINNGTANSAAVRAATPAQFVASVVRALEDAGVKREDITSEMLADYMKKLSNDDPNVIQAKAI